MGEPVMVSCVGCDKMKDRDGMYCPHCGRPGAMNPIRVAQETAFSPSRSSTAYQTAQAQPEANWVIGVVIALALGGCGAWLTSLNGGDDGAVAAAQTGAENDAEAWARATALAYYPDSRIDSSSSYTNSDGTITVNVEVAVPNAYGAKAVHNVTMKFDSKGVPIEAGDQFDHFR